jgi:membrane associated rhomboid family serine protease
LAIQKNTNLQIIFIFTFPLLIVSIFGLVKLFEYYSNISLSFLGVYPRELKGLIGVFTSHFIHSDFKHLANNSVPFYVLAVALFYFYKNISFRIFFLTMLVTNIWLWGFGRPSFHIGASGWLYALFFFIAVSGFIRKNKSLLIISLLSVFLYGGMVWGVFPIDYKISFEAHLSGAICGIVLALYYKDEGPKNEEYTWENEEEMDDYIELVEYEIVVPDKKQKPIEKPKIDSSNDNDVKINYIFKENKSKDNDSLNIA